MSYKTGPDGVLTEDIIQAIAANMDDQGDDRYSQKEVITLLKAQHQADIEVVETYIELGREYGAYASGWNDAMRTVLAGLKFIRKQS